MADSETLPLKFKLRSEYYPNKYTTDETLRLRVIGDALEQMNMDADSYRALTSKTFIHPQVSRELEKILGRTSFPPEDAMLVTKVLSADYHDREDVERMADLLTRKVCDEDVIWHLNRLFAVDGFAPELNYKYYVDSLKTQVFEDTRKFTYDEFGMFVLAVRHFYKRFHKKATPLTVHAAACEIMENKNLEDLSDEASVLIGQFGNWVERIKEKVIRKKIDDELEAVGGPRVGGESM